MLEEKATVRFPNRFTNYPFLVKRKDHEDQVSHGGPMSAVDIGETIPMKKLMNSASLALGKAYIRGKLEMEGSLHEVLDHFLGQMDRFSTSRLHLRKLLHPSNSRKSQKMEVSSHYDIDNDFYKLWLDEIANYPCGCFKSEKDTLYEAQMSKTGYILEKLVLKEGMSLLNVDCGWGFLLTRVTREYGVKGTGITLSTEQYDGFKEHIEEEGLGRLLNVQLIGYRGLPKGGMKLDRMISVDMVKHVSRENYGKFVDCVDKVSNPGDVFLLHSISSQKKHIGDPWVEKYVSPGGVIPSLRETVSLMAEYDFHILDAKDLKDHYSKTLLCQEKNFRGHKKEIKDILGEEPIRI